MQKLLLKCGLSPGDVVMLTAAVRDLHRAHPRRFIIDVRTTAPELWENNPWITHLDERDPRVRVLFSADRPADVAAAASAAGVQYRRSISPHGVPGPPASAARSAPSAPHHLI